MTREEILQTFLDINYVYNNCTKYDTLKRMLDELAEPKTDSDCISRQAVLSSIKNLYPDMPIVDIMGARRKWLDKYAPYFECENAVEHLPSVTPQEPKAGHWISHIEHCNQLGLLPSGLGSYYWCSECDCGVESKHFHLINYNYCPNCGAKMEV